MKRKIDVIKVKREQPDILTAEYLTIFDDLSDFYREIDCHTIDIVQRRFKGRLFDIICDDEALLKAEPGLPTSLWFNEKREKGVPELLEGLFGTLLLCHNDGHGELTSVTPEDLIKVQQAYTIAGTSQGDSFVCLQHDL